MKKQSDKERKKSIRPRHNKQVQQSQTTDFVQASSNLANWPEHRTARSVRQAAVLQMQRQHGNAYVQRVLGQRAESKRGPREDGRLPRHLPGIQRACRCGPTFNCGEKEEPIQRATADGPETFIRADGHPPVPIQRDEGDAPAATSDPPLKETTVPVPEEHRKAVDEATGGGEKAAGDKAAAKEGEKPAGEKPSAPPPVPEKAKVKAPVDFKFEALPPNLQVKFLEEFKFSATVTAARLAWYHKRMELGLGYKYGGDITATGKFGTGIGTFSGSAGFDPSAMEGKFGAGWKHKRWNLGLTGTTGLKFGASLGYGAKLPPMYGDLSSSIYAGEAGARGLMGAVPGVLSDPTTLPGVISAHGGDIDAIGKAAKKIGKVADLTDRETKGIDWGFYIRATAAPGTGLAVTGGAGLMFSRDPASTPCRRPDRFD